MEGVLRGAFQNGGTLLARSPEVVGCKMSLGDSELISSSGVEGDWLKS